MPVPYNTSVHSRRLSQNPGYYRVHRLELRSNQRGSKPVDVSFEMSQLDVFENLGGCLSGTITLLDTKNLIESLPIVGDETLSVHVDDEAGEKIDREFRVYKISDRSEVRPGALGYRLHFVSQEGFADSYIRVSKAYTEKRYEEAVEDIFRAYLKSSATLLLEPSKVQHCFVIPYWSPIEACHWMASRCQSSTYTGGTYVFFETAERFNFLSLDNLLDESYNKPYATVVPSSMRRVRGRGLPYDQRNPDDTMAFEEWRVVESFDVLAGSRSGMYANRVPVVNIMAKEPRVQQFTYGPAAGSSGSGLAAVTTDGFDSQKHLRGMLGAGQPMVASSFPPVTAYESHLRPVIRHQGLFTKEKDGGFREEEWVHKAISQHRQLNNFVVEGVLPGSLGLRAGMQVRFNYPLVKNLATNPVQEVDRYYSGCYLVTSVRRMFQKDKFYLVVQMAKDSVGLSRDTETV